MIKLFIKMMAFSLCSGPLFSSEILIACDINGSYQGYNFTISGNIPSMAEYNRIIDLLSNDNAKNCIGLESPYKINYEPFPCPYEDWYGCRKNDPIIYNNCLLDELKGIQNLESSSAIQASDLASKKCLAIAEDPSILQKWKYKN